MTTRHREVTRGSVGLGQDNIINYTHIKVAPQNYCYFGEEEIKEPYYDLLCRSVTDS